MQCEGKHQRRSITRVHPSWNKLTRAASVLARYTPQLLALIWYCWAVTASNLSIAEATVMTRVLTKQRICSFYSRWWPTHSSCHSIEVKRDCHVFKTCRGCYGLIGNMCLAPLRWVKGRRDRSYWKRRIRRMSATLIESRMNGHGAENNNVAGQYQKVATGRAYRLPREHNGNRRLESIPPEGSLRYGRSIRVPILCHWRLK